MSVTTIHVGSMPSFAAYDPGNGFVYVTNYASNTISVINGTRVVKSIGVGTEPQWATYDSQNGYVYVSNVGSLNVSVINGTTLLRSVTVGSDPWSSICDNATGFVYVANYGSGNVSVINGTRVVGSLKTGIYSQFGAYDAANGYVYVANVGSANVSVIHGTKIAGSIDVGITPFDLTYDSRNGYVYVPDMDSDTVSVINGTRVISTLNVGGNPYAAVGDLGNGYMYVTNSLSDNVSVINGTHVVGSAGTGSSPYAGVYDSGTGYVYVANVLSSNVSVIGGTKIVGSVTVGSNPVFPTYDAGNGYVYVPNQGSGTVTALPTWLQVTFTEDGLPMGTEWWVNVTRGSSVSSNTSSLSFNLPDGSFAYSIASANKSYASSAGSFVVDGAPASVTVPFSLVTYPVTFTETGLAPGTPWMVTLGDSTLASNGTDIRFASPNGTFADDIGPIAGWTTPTLVGSVGVYGAGVRVAVPWTRVTYTVTFTESGLPISTEWWVNVTSGQATPSDGATLSFREPNGTYPYTVAAHGGEYSSPGGSFTVAGSNLSLAATFSEVNFTVTFGESGLPSETGWWVNVTGGPSTFSTSEFLSFDEPNGTYAYSVSGIDQNYSAPGGSLVVNGAAVSETAAFSLTAFPVTFAEIGLPAGATWSATFRGTTVSGTDELTFWTVPNGTYSFTIGSVTGYAANRTSGAVQVRGAGVSVPIAFVVEGSLPGNGTGPPTFLGLPSAEGYGVLGGVLVAILVVTMVVVLLRRRGGKASPMSAKPDVRTPPASP
jgi:YVTN family beta-propeller protein